jgi:putative hydrolase of the HAD superfamily
MKYEVKALVFDIGGVIYVGKQRGNLYMPELLGIDQDVWRESTKKIQENLNVGCIDENAGLLEMACNLKIDKDKIKKAWIKTFHVRFILNKTLLKIIRRLKKNYKTAILSNQWSMPYKILITKEIKSNFDVMVFSHQVGFKKPSENIYHLTLQRLNLKSNECVFIDDIEENLVPAKKLGMKTILFKNNKQLIQDLKKFGVKI